MGDVACPLSAEEVPSLTVSKLKAELTRLNQPIGGLKRKAQLVEALTAYIEKQLQQGQTSPAQATAVGTDQSDAEDHATLSNSANSNADATAETSEGSQGEPLSKKANEGSGETAETSGATQISPEEGKAEGAIGLDEARPDGGTGEMVKEAEVDGGKADRMAEAEGGTEIPAEEPSATKVMSGETEADTTSDGPQTNAMETEDTSNAAASANVTTESPSKRTSKATPRKSRKRTSRAFEGDTETPTEGAGEANGGGGGGDRDDKREPKTPAPSAETPEKPKTKRSRRSTGKKVRDAAAAAAAASNPSADVLEPREAKDNQAGARRRDADGKAKAVSGRNGDGDNGSGADPMDEEKLAVVAPASEPAGVTPSATPAPDVEADAGGEGEKDVEEDGGGDTGEPKTVTIRVDNFVRPFTAAQAKKLLEEKAGTPVLEGGFWMDSIKTHCYATFSTRAAADKAVAGLQGLQWPLQSFKRLEAKIGDMSAEDAKSRDESKRTTRPFTPKRAALRLGPPVTPTAAKTPTNSSADADADTANANGDGHPEGTAANGASGTPGAAGTGSGRRSSGGVRGRGSVQAPGSNGGVLTEAEAGKGVGAKGQQEEAEEPIVLDEIFRKTEAKPSLYWLPLSEEEVGERKTKMEEDGVGPRTTPMPAEQIEASIGTHRRGSGGGGGNGGSGGRRGYAGGAPYPYRRSYGGGDPHYGRAGVGGRRR